MTLEDMLRARDRRREYQEELLARWPQHSLILLTVVAPGKQKRNANTLTVASAAQEALAGAFATGALLWEKQDLPTGFELWIVSPLSATEAKRRAVEIERNHPLGRLMDIDVITSGCIPISRESLGYAPRECLICGDGARVCMRAGKHSYEELLKQIDKIVNDYVGNI